MLFPVRILLQGIVSVFPASSLRRPRLRSVWSRGGVRGYQLSSWCRPDVRAFPLRWSHVGGGLEIHHGWTWTRQTRAICKYSNKKISIIHFISRLQWRENNNLFFAIPGVASSNLVPVLHNLCVQRFTAKRRWTNTEGAGSHRHGALLGGSDCLAGKDGPVK